MRGASPYPTQPEARGRFVNRRLKLLRNLILWRKHASDLFGVGNLIGHLLESSLVIINGRMDEPEKAALKIKLTNMVPVELLPAVYK